MSFTLYELQDGSIGRKAYTETGLITKRRYLKGDRLVLSPGEMRFNEHRIKAVGEVADDSPEVLEAILNTNKLDHPDFGKPKGAFKPETITDIRKADGENAKTVISATSDLAKLDEFMEQELNNKLRVRKFVIKAIEMRKAELQEPAPQQS